MAPENESNDTRWTVMVVDEDAGALKLLQIMFKRGGLNVITAQGADAALELLDQQTPDLIITDIMMPGMDGFELCRVLRSREDTRKLPIVIYSARNNPESIRQGLAAGATDYLPKPTPHPQLVARIKELIAESRQA